MRAARLHDYGKALVIDEVPTPSPGAGEVLIAVEGAGFCHYARVKAGQVAGRAVITS